VRLLFRNYHGLVPFIPSLTGWLRIPMLKGIQTMCRRRCCLPTGRRTTAKRTAQHAGLTDIVLRDMVLFPIVPNFTAAAAFIPLSYWRATWRTRGMLFHTSWSAPRYRQRTQRRREWQNGVSCDADSMRLRSDEVLKQCWSLVNIALAPAQRKYS
jgi:hypothetical protein